MSLPTTIIVIIVIIVIVIIVIEETETARENQTRKKKQKGCGRENFTERRAQCRENRYVPKTRNVTAAPIAEIFHSEIFFLLWPQTGGYERHLELLLLLLLLYVLFHAIQLHEYSNGWFLFHSVQHLYFLININGYVPPTF